MDQTIQPLHGGEQSCRSQYQQNTAPTTLATYKQNCVALYQTKTLLLAKPTAMQSQKVAQRATH